MRKKTNIMNKNIRDAKYIKQTPTYIIPESKNCTNANATLKYT